MHTIDQLCDKTLTRTSFKIIVRKQLPLPLLNAVLYYSHKDNCRANEQNGTERNGQHSTDLFPFLHSRTGMCPLCFLSNTKIPCMLASN